MMEAGSVEWFRWMNENNDKWLGAQAKRLWEHYLALEAKCVATEAAVEAARLGIDDIRDALQSQEHGRTMTIMVALDLCQEAMANVSTALATLEQHE